MPSRSEFALGFLFGNGTAQTTATFQLNAAANWLAMGFVPDRDRTLSSCRAYVSAVAGTLGGSDVTCDLYDNSGTNGTPGTTALETGKVPTATITAAGWYTWTGFSTALTAGQTYWLVFKNVNGTPASNSPTFRQLTGLAGDFLLGSAATGTRHLWGRSTSTNSGSTWGNVGGQTGLRVGYSDGTYDGFPLHNVATAAIGDGVYGSRESGVKFTAPAGANLRVSGVAFLSGNRNGTPTGLPRFGLWTGDAPVLRAYTASLPSGVLANMGTRWNALYFAEPQVVRAGETVRVTMGETSNADASGNRYNQIEWSSDTDGNSTPLLPWGGTCTKTYFDGSTWTDSALGTSVFAHALLLDQSRGFDPFRPAPRTRTNRRRLA